MIAHAVWLYFRFPLGLRMVEDMLAARGIIVSHQTVRLWAEKFGRHFANDIRKRSAGRLGDKWYLDEVVITIQRKKHWLWRAVDQDGFVLVKRPGVAPRSVVSLSQAMIGLAVRQRFSRRKPLLSRMAKPHLS